MDYKDLVRVPACFHKSPYYAVEEEVRLMMFDDSATVKARYSVENQEFEQEYNYRNDIITYHKLEIGEQNIHIFKPEVIIRRIELGFRHSEEFFKHFSLHMEDIFLGKLMRKEWIDNQIILEHSPLKNIYR